jgi:hypothetical protein
MTAPLCHIIARRAKMQQPCRAQTDCALFGHALAIQQSKPNASNKQRSQANNALLVYFRFITYRKLTVNGAKLALIYIPGWKPCENNLKKFASWC